MKRLIAAAAAVVLALTLAAPAAAFSPDRHWTPEDGRAGVAGPWYSATQPWLDGLRCETWQRYSHQLTPAALSWVLYVHGWTGDLADYLALTPAEQCAWALSH